MEHAVKLSLAFRKQSSYRWLLEKNAIRIELSGGPLNGAQLDCARSQPLQVPVASATFKSSCATSQPPVTVLTYAPTGQVKVDGGNVREVYAVKR